MIFARGEQKPVTGMEKKEKGTTTRMEKPLMIPRMSSPGMDCTQCHAKQYLNLKQK